jgi:hypothetical protein
MARCFAVLGVGGFSCAALFEDFEYAARDRRDERNKKSSVLQRQQPRHDGGNPHCDEQDIEPAAKLVHRFDYVQIVIMQAGLDFEQHGKPDEELVAEVEAEGERLGNVVSPESGGEGEHGYEAKKNEGGDKSARLDLLKQVKELVLQHPETRRHSEGNNKGEPVAEGFGEGVTELAVRNAGGHLDIKDKQRHDDGEDRIAEGFEPVFAVHGVIIVLDCAQECKRELL